MDSSPDFPVPADETERLSALARLGILDTGPDPRFDRIVRMAAAHFRVPVARVTFVDADRVWFKSCIGLSVTQAPRRIALCAHAILGAAPLVVTDLSADPRFAMSPQVAGKPHFRFYAGAPIDLGDGLRLGTICLMDYLPRPDFRAAEIAFLQDLAAIVVDELQLTRKVADRESVIDLRTRDLRESQERFALAMKGANDGLWDWDFRTNAVYYSPRWCEMLGYAPDEIEQTLEGGWKRLVDPEELDRVLDEVQDYLSGRAPGFETEFRMRHRDGSWVTVLSRAHLVRDDGVPVRLVGTHVDISLRKRLEEQVRQAQKMDVLGRMTGGIAHDFNNLLGVIRGNAEMLAEDIPAAGEYVCPILSASRRGAALVKRLLAFSRRQPLRPHPIRVQELVAGMSDMLRRSLGETIAIEIREAEGLWHASADPGQVEDALLNLAINARDAMPEGGRLTIGCANVTADAGNGSGLEPGDYVMLAVGDTGTGMPAEVKARAFEPFFTTKEPGKGNGLGLSMVYGFARQSGGHLVIDSAEGEGTTMRLYLPRAGTGKAPAPTKAGVEATAPQGRGEHILVVEDDAEIRGLVVRMLTHLGYSVTDVDAAEAARAALAQGAAVDLVLSDVVLPGGTSGVQLAEQLRDEHPGIKVIFMSGYAADAVLRDGALGPDPVLLNKPFERCQLAVALHDALHSGCARRRRSRVSYPLPGSLSSSVMPSEPKNRPTPALIQRPSRA